MDLPHFPMPQSVPAGMRLELSRGKLLPNSEKSFSDWALLSVWLIPNIQRTEF
jgi:hypothetical protein